MLGKLKLKSVIGGAALNEGLALNGYKVNLEDFYPEVIEKAKVGINGSLDKLIASGKINDAAKKAALDNIKFFNNIGEAVKNVDLSIEVVPEIYNIKVNCLRAVYFIAICIAE